jgi:hypothetical protein
MRRSSLVALREWTHHLNTSQSHPARLQSISGLIYQAWQLSHESLFSVQGLGLLMLHEDLHGPSDVLGYQDPVPMLTGGQGKCSNTLEMMFRLDLVHYLANAPVKQGCYEQWRDKAMWVSPTLSEGEGGFPSRDANAFA